MGDTNNIGKTSRAEPTMRFITETSQVIGGRVLFPVGVLVALVDEAEAGEGEHFVDLADVAWSRRR